MKTFQESNISLLEWKRPQLMKRYYELRANDEVLATLEQTGVFSNNVIVETAQGRWNFKTEGFFKTRTIILDSATGEEIASIKGSTGGDGELTFPDGRSFTWSTTSFWKGTRAWSLGGGTPLVEFRKSGKQVEIAEGARKVPELGLLISFGFYMLRMYEDTSTAATGA